MVRWRVLAHGMNVFSAMPVAFQKVSSSFFLKPLIHKNKPLVAYRLNVPEQFNNLRSLGKLTER